MKLKIKVRKIDPFMLLPDVCKKGDWIDLRAAKSVNLKAPQAGTLRKVNVLGKDEARRDVSFDYSLVPLGVAMQLPKGFEAVVLPRSSTFKEFGIIQSNSQGVIDSSYCGNNDEWKLPVIALRETTVCQGVRICQFRIQLSQKATMWQKLKWLFSSGVKIVEVKSLKSPNRNGFGSTGVK